MADRRSDCPHKLTTRLVHEHPGIAVESLPVKNLVRNPSLAQSIAAVSGGEMVRPLEYQADWHGRTGVKVDKVYPLSTSKRCCDCGSIAPKRPIAIRSGACPEWGETHDRDINAAQNLLV